MSLMTRLMKIDHDEIAFFHRTCCQCIGWHDLHDHVSTYLCTFCCYTTVVKIIFSVHVDTILLCQHEQLYSVNPYLLYCFHIPQRGNG